MKQITKILSLCNTINVYMYIQVYIQYSKCVWLSSNKVNLTCLKVHMVYGGNKSCFTDVKEYIDFLLYSIKNNRCEQGSNLRGQCPLDFKSNALTTRPSQLPTLHNFTLLLLIVTLAKSKLKVVLL